MSQVFVLFTIGCYLLGGNFCRAAACGIKRVQPSIYFVPRQSDYCSGNRVCARFRKEVQLQGSGFLNNGRVLRFARLNFHRGENPTTCPTVIGAAGCLIPFFSVAADLHYYRPGTIISIPALRGKFVQLPGVGLRRYPGYFIVQDTGVAIRGRARFDFFTGTMGPYHPQNAFGYFSAVFGRTLFLLEGEQGDLQMTAKRSCNKKFSVVPYLRNSKNIQWRDAMKQIESTASASVDLTLAGYSISQATTLPPSK